jgi:hypothetical protein
MLAFNKLSSLLLKSRYHTKEPYKAFSPGKHKEIYGRYTFPYRSYPRRLELLIFINSKHFQNDNFLGQSFDIFWLIWSLWPIF